MRSLALLLCLVPGLASAQAEWTDPAAPPCEAVTGLYTAAVDGFEGLESDSLTTSVVGPDLGEQIRVRRPHLRPLAGDDVRQVFENRGGGDLAYSYNVTLSGLTADAGPEPTVTATALVTAVTEAIASCLDDGLMLIPAEGQILSGEYQNQAYVGSQLIHGGRFQAGLAVYAFEEGALAEALRAEASGASPHAYTMVQPAAPIERADRIVVRLQVLGARL